MAKLSMDNEKSKRFDFTLDGDDLKAYTWRFVPATMAANTQKYITLSISLLTKCRKEIYSLTRVSYVNGSS